MKNIDVKTMFYISLISIFIMCSSILIMPLIVINDIFAIISSVTFWLFCLVGYSIYIIAAVKMKKQVKPEEKNKNKIGIIKFFQNKGAVMFDILLLLSLICLIIVSFSQYKNDYIAYLLLFLVLISFNYHCILNGKLYKYIFNNKKNEKTNRKKREKNERV